VVPYGFQAGRKPGPGLLQPDVWGLRPDIPGLIGKNIWNILVFLPDKFPGMIVDGMPMTLLPPVGCSTRCAKALVEIGKADGL